MSIASTRRLAATLLLAAAAAVPSHAATVVSAGPLVNPATGSRYYRLSNGDWNSLRASAVAMGGDLATINNAAENAWVVANMIGGTKPFIGLNDAAQEGTFVWADGSASTYRNWQPGEPNNTAIKDSVYFDGTPAGTWSLNGVAFSNEAIAEFSGPIKVPQEISNLPAAVAALPNSGTNEIVLAPGTYTLSNFLTLSGVTIRGSGRGQTIINTTDNNIGLFLTGGVVIENLTLVNRASGSTIVAFDGLSRLRNVTLTSQLTTATGALIDVGQQPGAVLSLENCELHTSEIAVQVFGGSLYAVNTIFRDLSSVSRNSNTGTKFVAVNCVFTRCANSPLFAAVGATSVENSIFHQINGTILASNVTLANCNLPNATGSNFSGDPRFVSTGSNDFRLRSDSPCIDRGYIAAYFGAFPQDFVDFGGNDRAIDDPARANFFPGLRPIDVGAFEFVPAGPTPCPGDLNNDRQVDDADFVLFADGYNQLLCP
jgi:hypothetical protein